MFFFTALLGLTLVHTSRDDAANVAVGGALLGASLSALFRQSQLQASTSSD